MTGEDGVELLTAWGRVDVIQKLTSEQSLEGGKGTFETFALSLRDNTKSTLESPETSPEHSRNKQ